MLAFKSMDREDRECDDHKIDDYNPVQRVLKILEEMRAYERFVIGLLLLFYSFPNTPGEISKESH